MNIFLRPSDRGINKSLNKSSNDYNEGHVIGLHHYLDLVFSGFPQVFPAFEEEDQVDLLEALASLILQVTPEKGKDLNENVLAHSYKSVIKMCTATVLKGIEIDFNHDLLISFVKSVLQNSVTVTSNLSTSEDNKDTAEYVLNYLPFIAELEEFISPITTKTKEDKEVNTIFHPIKRDVDQDLFRLVQQYMVACVMFTVNDPKVFNLWSEPLDRISRFLPALLERKPKVDFSTVRIRIQELLSLIKPKSFQKKEDIYPIFTNLLPNVPAKQLLSLDLADTVYALSIYFIEMIRAERGIVGPIFEYIEVEYTPSFTAILDAMFDPILKTFFSYLGSISDLERRTSCAAFTMKELITRFCLPNDRVQKRIEPIIKNFSETYPMVICDLQVLAAVTRSLEKFIEDDPDHLQKPSHFEKLVQKLLNDALEFAPDLLFSAIFHSQVQAAPYASPGKKADPPQEDSASSILSINGRSTFESLLLFSDSEAPARGSALTNKVNATSGPLVRLVEMLPAEKRAKLINEFVAKAVATGQSQFVVSPAALEGVRDYEQRALLAASYFIQHPNDAPDVLSGLISYGGQDPGVQMIAWSHISMHSIKLSKVLVSYMLDAFRETIENGLGIFAGGREDELNLGSRRARNGGSSESDETMRIIKYQTKVLNFFSELHTVGQHHARFSAVLIPAMEAKLLNSSAIIPAVLSLVYLICLILNTPYQMSQRVQHMLKEFALRLSLTAYSYAYDDYVLQYVTPVEVFFLERIVTVLPSTLCSHDYDSAQGSGSKGSKEKGTKATSLNQSLSLSSASSPSKGKVAPRVLVAVDKARVNYVKEKITDQETFKTFANLVSFLLCDELMLFAMYVMPQQAGTNPSLQRLMALRQMKPSKMHLRLTTPLIWRSAPEALYPFCLMPAKSIGKSVMAVVSQLMEKDLYTAPSVPMLSLVYVQTPKFNPHPLVLWKAMPANKALALLDPSMMSNKSAASYVARCFQLFSKRESLLFLPQLVQSLRFDQCGIMRDFLTKYCKTSEVFTHYLLWNILAEKDNPIGSNDNLPDILKRLETTIIENMNERERTNYKNEFELIDKLDEVSKKLLKMEIDKRPPALVDMLKEMKIPEGLYIPSNPNYKIISIDAERSVPLKSHARVPILVNFTVYDEDAELAEQGQASTREAPDNDDSDDNEEDESESASDNNNDDDSDNDFSEASDDDDSGKKGRRATKKERRKEKKERRKEKKQEKKREKAKKKAKKKGKKGDKNVEESKYLNSETEDRRAQTEEANNAVRERLLARHKPVLFSCIFKINDDVRQDAMMIQFIDMIKQILTDAGIDAFLFPYRVFTTGKDRGVIECIHDAKSRHDIGVSTGEDLLNYFINKYGQVGTPEFNAAQSNFIKSVAPYSLVCYLFQVKDRHNANIMLDEDGHVIHIDFGFIFEISPGGNVKFERSPFKLTKEMIDLLGGSKEAPAFQRFSKLFVQCFFAVRARHKELEAITALMMNAGFPCFLSDSIKKLQTRFFLDKSSKDALSEILRLIDQAYDAKSTVMYDAFQKAQNNIFF